MKKLTTFVACAANGWCVRYQRICLPMMTQVARAQDYLNSKGIAYTVTASDVDKALAAGYTADSLVAKQTSCWTVQSLIPKVQRTRLSAS